MKTKQDFKSGECPTYPESRKTLKFLSPQPRKKKKLNIYPEKIC
jgi:hypothetical protein